MDLEEVHYIEGENSKIEIRTARKWNGEKSDVYMFIKCNDEEIKLNLSKSTIKFICAVLNNIND